MIADNYKRYSGMIVRVELTAAEKEGFNVADYVGILAGTDETSILLSPYTHQYISDSPREVRERLKAYPHNKDDITKKLVSDSIILGKRALRTTELFLDLI